jgi:hypothetical protein
LLLEKLDLERWIDQLVAD